MHYQHTIPYVRWLLVLSLLIAFVFGSAGAWELAAIAPLALPRDPAPGTRRSAP